MWDQPHPTHSHIWTDVMLDTCAAVHDTILEMHCVMLLSLKDLVVFAEEQEQYIMEVIRVEPNISTYAINHSTW